MNRTLNILTLLFLTFWLYGTALATSNVIPNSAFLNIGPYGNPVPVCSPNEGPAAPANWWTFIPDPNSCVTTTVLGSTDTIQAGGNMLEFQTNTGFIGSSGNGVFALTTASLPANSLGYVDIWVPSGSSGLLGFQVNGTRFSPTGSYSFSDTGGKWQRVYYANPESGTNEFGLDIFSSNGGTIYIANPTAPVPAPEDRAWVWSTNTDTSTHQWTPALGYQYNSEGGNNTITHLSQGYYRVDMPNLATDLTPGGGGTALVTAYGGNQSCKSVGWIMDSGGVHLYVYCFTAAGSLTDALFDALWYRRGLPQGFDAYVWANNPSVSSYTPTLTYQWNSANLTNTINRLGIGSYQVSIPGFSSLGGTVAVSAYGSSSDRCRVNSWYPNSGKLLVYVSCTNGGQPHDSQFTLGFTNDMALGSPWWFLGAFAWADQPSNPSCYVPSPQYQFNRYGSQLNICRTGVGHYDVHISNFGGVGSGQTTALATAYGGPAGSYCTIQNWSTFSSQWIARVSCYDSGGSPLDTPYTIQFLADLRLPTH